MKTDIRSAAESERCLVKALFRATASLPRSDSVSMVQEVFEACCKVLAVV